MPFASLGLGSAGILILFRMLESRTQHGEARQISLITQTTGKKGC